ncbi:MAG TPA: hypothetical protein VFM23_04170, partial [Gemmatimonadales bacterium]|nr:hypothetical protein [Gemmatimonadales bacterium]
AGYHLLFQPPQVTGFPNSLLHISYPQRFGVMLDVQRLAVEYILIIGGALVFWFAGRARRPITVP